MKIPYVDENDVEIGLVERSETTPEHIYRVSALWLTNSKDEVLIAQRAFVKARNLGLWGPAVAGTVEEGETYDSNMVKEIEEEIGLKVSVEELTLGPKLRLRGEHNFFDQIYFLKRDIPLEEFVLQKEEVESVQWISVPDLRKACAERPQEFLRIMPSWVEQFSS